MNIVLDEEARLELLEAAAYYELRQEGLSQRFTDAVLDQLNEITEEPERFPFVIKHYRKSLVPRFPYVIIFSVDMYDITIWAVSHQKRKPFYWRSRIKKRA